jgi:glycerol-3-phosphate dehydrogenase (NAD(P)+)
MTEQRPIAVLGGGSFGTAVANLLAENGHQVLQWMRDPEQAEAIRVNRENPRYLKGIKILPGVTPVTDLQATLDACDLCFVALPSSALRSVLAPHAERLRGKFLVSLTKGIEAHTFKLMSEILEEIAPQARIGVLSGPNLAREVAEHALTATVVASEDEALPAGSGGVARAHLSRICQCRPFRCGAGRSVEKRLRDHRRHGGGAGHGRKHQEHADHPGIGGNDPLRGESGCQPNDVPRPGGVGDLIVTCIAEKPQLSGRFRPRPGLSLDEAVNRLGEVAEGVNTLKVLKAKAQEVGVYMPLVAGLHAILFEGRTLEQVIELLMRAEPKTDVDFISTSGFN